ncbi:MAG: DUF3352 domain-containing protein [Planctomycetota bacterium]
MIERIWEGNPIRSREHNGVTLHVVGEEWTYGAWTFLDDVAILADDVEPVEAAIDARQRGVLADADAYQAAVEGLPATNVALAYFGVDQALDAAGVNRTDLTGDMRQWLDNLALGAALTVNDDVLTVRVTTSNPRRLAEMVRIAAGQMPMGRCF